ncbi:hypothetical protein BKA83DRAFT_4273350 [Pisolithus microcarpus]|nr:hypothetical protein BKA83DRAFT_4273350 [Pisolithus microcarpus]
MPYVLIHANCISLLRLMVLTASPPLASTPPFSLFDHVVWRNCQLLDKLTQLRSRLQSACFTVLVVSSSYLPWKFLYVDAMSRLVWLTKFREFRKSAVVYAVL